MSWNGYSNSLKNILIRNFTRKYNTPSDPNLNFSDYDSLQKVWIRIPNLGHKDENVINSAFERFDAV